MRNAIVFGAAVTISSIASAELPGPALIGAEQVVIACDFDDDLPVAMREKICAQLVAKAQQVSTLPVSLASSSERGSDLRNLRTQWKQLRLRVSVQAADVEPGRKSLQLGVSAERPGRPIAALGPIASTVSLIEAQGDWVMLGPVAGFNKLLGGGPRPLRTPIVSE